MSLGGTHLDHYLEVFKGIVAMEVQQMGSLLGGIPIVEVMAGNKTWFDKLGKVASMPKTQRLQEKVFSDITFERRLVQSAMITFDEILDVEDLIKYVDNPSNDIVRAAGMEMGRQKDVVIMNAITGNASVQTNGTVANVALTQSIAVNSNGGGVDRTGAALGSGNTALHPGKLKQARKQLTEIYGVRPNDELVVIAPIGQLSELLNYDEVINSRYNTAMPLAGAGTYDRLSGYMNLQFVAYENTGVDGSANELVYVVTKDAIRLGVFQDMKVEFLKMPTLVGNPTSISVTQSLGAVRMDENKVISIACSPKK